MPHGNTRIIDGDKFREYFKAKTEINERGCWEWQGKRDPHGYGRLMIAGRWWFAHRAAWRVFQQDDPIGFHICHHCDNPCCVNPDHLFKGTDNDNVQDCIKKDRNCRGARHRGAKLSDAKVEEIFDLRSKGLSHQKIADIIGARRLLVRKILCGKAWRHVSRAGLPIERPATYSKTTETTVRKIFELRGTGLSQEKISRIVGIAQTSVGRILRGVRWKRLGEQMRSVA